MTRRPRRLRGPATMLLLLGVVTAACLLGGLPTASADPSGSGDVQHGRNLFLQSCASCHGVDGEGTQRGPTLVGVGEAAVDFYLSTGRMPLAQEQTEATRGTPKFPPSDINDLVAYVGSLDGGPAIPETGPGSLTDGEKLYLQNCAACHGSSALGYTQVGGQTAPSLYAATPTQIAEAVRIGPGTMPHFDESVLDADQVNSLISYIQYLRKPTVGAAGGANIGRIGPVTETLVGFAAVGLLLIVIRLIGKKSPGKRSP